MKKLPRSIGSIVALCGWRKASLAASIKFTNAITIIRKNNSLASIVFVLGCFMQAANVSAAVVVDGVMDGGEYSNHFTANWINAHKTGVSIYKDWTDTTEVWWDQDADNMYLYLEVPLDAKNMLYGAGCDAVCKDEYNDHYISHHPGKKIHMDYGQATGSQAAQFAVITGVIFHGT